MPAVCFFGLDSGRPKFEDGDFLVCVNSDGAVELHWPEASPAAVYHLEVRCGETRYEEYYSRPAAYVAGLPAGEEAHIRVWAVADGKDLFGKPRPVSSWKTLKADFVLNGDLAAPEVTGTLESGQAALSWTGEGDRYEVFQVHTLSAPGAVSSVHVASTEEPAMTLPIEEGSLRWFTVRAGWERKGFVLCGPAASPVSPGGKDLPEEGELSLVFEETAPRMYILEWNGIQCQRFDVQERQNGEWQTIAHLMPEERMRYDLGRLRSGSYNEFRVAAAGGPGRNGGGAEEVSFYASISPLYATIWPIQDLTLYEDPGKSGRIASIPAGTALCVLAEEGDWFRVRYQEDYGWVDSRFCMIDLPEYVGDHCEYDITNSYQSLFSAHNAPIQKITGQVIPGFEDIRTADGEFLVPYLYPCAKKLLSAAQAAQADDLRLKIYEAFRPRQATRFLYDTTEAQRNDPVQGRNGEQTTLLRLMTDNGRFGLGSFLARTISAHNRGIALDLTLVNTKTGEELEMQSGIHDLSWYAATDRNNLNALILADYMTSAGMNGLSSEWWHFQDDATKTAIGLKADLYQGVSAEGWKQDDNGWRYRNADGSYVRNSSLTVDGKSYTFDAGGYTIG